MADEVLPNMPYCPLLAVILLSFFLPCKRFIKFFITPLSKLARIGLEAAVIAMIEVLTSTGPLGIHFSMKVLGSYKVMQVLPSSLKR